MQALEFIQKKGGYSLRATTFGGWLLKTYYCLSVQGFQGTVERSIEVQVSGAKHVIISS